MQGKRSLGEKKSENEMVLTELSLVDQACYDFAENLQCVGEIPGIGHSRKLPIRRFSQKESYETPEIHLLHLARWAQRDGIDKEDVIRNLPLRHLTLEKCQQGLL